MRITKQFRSSKSFLRNCYGLSYSINSLHFMEFWGGESFKHRLGYQLPWLGLLMTFLGNSRKILWKNTKISPQPLPFIRFPLFLVHYHLIIWRHIFWSTESVVNPKWHMLAFYLNYTVQTQQEQISVYIWMSWECLYTLFAHEPTTSQTT
jgi:hypothetical protein